MKDQTDPRHNARKLALASLYCGLFSSASSPTSTDFCSITAKQLLEESYALQTELDIDKTILQNIISGVTQRATEIDEIVKTSAPEWPIDKIARIDLIILRIATYELLYGLSAPTKVVVDEAVELAKEFGSETSQKFVNGVLGTIIDLKEKSQDDK